MNREHREMLREFAGQDVEDDALEEEFSDLHTRLAAAEKALAETRSHLADALKEGAYLRQARCDELLDADKSALEAQRALAEERAKLRFVIEDRERLDGLRGQVLCELDAERAAHEATKRELETYQSLCSSRWEMFGQEQDAHAETRARLEAAERRAAIHFKEADDWAGQAHAAEAKLQTARRDALEEIVALMVQAWNERRGLTPSDVRALIGGKDNG